MLTDCQVFTNLGPKLQTEAQSPEAQTDAEISSLSEIWARRYIKGLQQQDQRLTSLDTSQARLDVAQKLVDMLRSVSARAWHKTETLLTHEIRRHQIATHLIDPWAISKDVHQVYEEALAAYANQITPQRFSVQASKKLGEIRAAHTTVDPRLIGFVSMQFHYCGQMLCQEAPDGERSMLQQYFKVVDDLLYMPLHRAYQAAADYEYHHPRLEAVRLGLPVTTNIAHSIVDKVASYCPDYVTYTGPLASPIVRVSSVRDVEMFQIYLWTCVLEQNISAITQELFPLCVMLYPTLNVSWGLVRLMINLLDQELSHYVGSLHIKYYEPHYKALLKMFSPEVFPEAI
jgi:hypothetical protein